MAEVASEGRYLTAIGGCTTIQWEETQGATCLARHSTVPRGEMAQAPPVMKVKNLF